MKTRAVLYTGILFFLAFWMVSCSSVITTSWVNPKESKKVSKVLVWGLFDKTKYVKPFEHIISGYLNRNGVQTVDANTILDPSRKYDKATLKHKIDSLGVDAVLMVTYTGSEKQEAWLPYYPGYYPGWENDPNGFYWGYPWFYGSGYGYWYGYPYYYRGWSKTVYLQANLYSGANASLIWTGSIKMDDPMYLSEVSRSIACSVVSDWKKNQILGVKK